MPESVSVVQPHIGRGKEEKRSQFSCRMKLVSFQNGYLETKHILLILIDSLVK